MFHIQDCYILNENWGAGAEVLYALVNRCQGELKPLILSKTQHEKSPLKPFNNLSLGNFKRVREIQEINPQLTTRL